MARRQRVCRKVRGHRTKKCVYVTRDKRGRIIRVTNIGRSVRADARIRAKRRLKMPRDRGLGFAGDFKRRRR